MVLFLSSFRNLGALKCAMKALDNIQVKIKAFGLSAPAAPTDEGADDSKAYGSSGLFTLFFIMVAIAVAEGV